MKKLITYLFLIMLSFVFIGCKEDKTDPIDPTDPGTIDPELREEKYYASKLLLLDVENNYIELLDCPANKITSETKVYKKVDEEVKDASFSDLYCGMNNIYVKCYSDTVEQILIDGEAVFPRIRVAIRKTITNIADINTLYHDSVTVTVPFSTTIKTIDNEFEKEIEKNTELQISAGNDYISFWIGKVLYKVKNRLILNGKDDEEITINSISRSVGTPKYAGSLEFKNVNQKVLVVNDCLMESYLTKVVPSEMPSSWPQEALKAQAVAARTYAYKEIYNRDFINNGYVVDDSESSQVYNNISTRDTTTLAVNSTKGITMFYGNEPIKAYYCSGTCGLTGNGNEVWIENEVIDSIPYLIGKNLTDQTVNTKDEVSMLAFFKKITMSSPGGSSSYHRWCVTMTKSQLRQTINTNLPILLLSSKNSFLQLDNGEWVVKDFPSDIGEINNIFVSERGESGVVVSLQIEANNTTFRIYNQYNIRFTIRPKDCGSTVTTFTAKSSDSTYTGSVTNASILNSGFFALEWNNDALTFFGGGSGHGVGMPQYAALDYANKGNDYKTILEAFYSNIKFVNTSIEYEHLTDYEKYFK